MGEHELIDTFDTVDEAKAGGHGLIRMLGGVPPGWALAIFETDDGKWDLVQYQTFSHQPTEGGE